MDNHTNGSGWYSPVLTRSLPLGVLRNERSADAAQAGFERSANCRWEYLAELGELC